MDIRFLPLAFRYLWVVLAASIGLAGVEYALGTSFPGLGMIPSVVAAMDGGARMVKKAGRRPDGGEMWILSIVQCFVGLVLAVPVVAFVLYTMPGIIQQVPPIFIMIGLLIGLAFSILFNRVFIWLGVTAGMKHIQTETDPRVFQ